ncbi:hypothetical protein PACILC2_22810 [Paenibacillus cisolokensis]|uniref:Phage protein n=1 Tax=Paenibacillus cisolokensis TaxID=1658519 RepID=A0ABQ4N663_9BACL|nr:hypothetical protein [Paenibacillus cisolokensis]GIQ63713.1 hypothetical protein PACILC2_22810 [Paenibacillus cisolokensis]
MAVNIADADAYIAANCIDIEDWTDADDAKKQRILNVADRKLTTKYAQYTIPDAAVYEYANELAIAFNDTNRLQQQGVASFGLTGVANFTFKDWAKSGLDAWISDTVLDLISEANGGVPLSRRSIKWTVL